MDVAVLNKRLGMFLKGFELPPLERVKDLTPEELSGLLVSLQKAMSLANTRVIQVTTQRDAALKQKEDLQKKLVGEFGVDSLEGLEGLIEVELKKFEGLYVELDSYLASGV